MRSRTRLRTSRVIVSVALTSLTLITGCSSYDEGDAPLPVASSSGDITLFSGTTGNMTRDFNPFSHTSLSGTVGMVYETLFFFNQAKSGEERPWLAQKYAISPDGKKLTFTVRPNVKWSDGQPLTSDDVAFTFNYLRKNPLINTYGLPLAGATKINSTTVEVDFTQPAFAYVWYAAGQTPIVPQHVWQNISSPATSKNSNPIGTGPFQLKNFTPQSFVLAKNATYWQTGKPALSSVRFVSYSGNSAALNALNAGQIDWAGIFIPDVKNKFVAMNPSVNHYVKFSSGDITNLIPNLATWPTNQLPVRQAINYALDRSALNAQAFSGTGTMPSAAGVAVPRDQKYLSAAYKELRAPYDPAKATQTLEAAGYHKDSAGYYQDTTGRRLSVMCLVVSGWTDYLSAMLVIKDELKRVGIEFAAEEVSYTSFLDREHNGEFQLAIDNAKGGPGPYFLFNYMLNSANTAPVGQEATTNFARFSNPKADSLLAQAAGTDDQAILAQAYLGLEKIFVEQLPYIPVIQPQAMTEYRTEKFTGMPTPDNPYALPIVWEYPDLGVIASELKITNSGD